MEFVADLLYDLPKNYGLVFGIIHYIVCLQAERLDMGEKFAETTKTHPLVNKTKLFRLTNSLKNLLTKGDTRQLMQ